jgi:hypothetical protein
MSIFHRLRHLFGWNAGTVYSWWDADSGHLMRGFRCRDCGAIEGVSSTQYGSGVLPSTEPKVARGHSCDLNRLMDGSCGVCGRQKPWLAAGNVAQSKESDEKDLATFCNLLDTLSDSQSDKGDSRHCTCHPDDDPPVPCPKKYAFRECMQAAHKHIMNPTCWCEPELNYIDPDTGVAVYVHRGKQ